MFKPKKFLGQHFLKNSQIAEEVAKAAEIKPSDFVIEIGPGAGILTDELIKSGAEVLAIEKDFELVDKLRKNLKYQNLKISHQDILLFEPESISKPYKVVANIPYNITSPIIRKFLENENKPELMVLMVQKEVAERITAKPGNSERGYLTLIVEFFADSEILFQVSKNEFYPAPEVDSAVITIRPNQKKSHPRGGVKMVEMELFFKIVKAGFSSKRQQIHNSLAATLRLDKIVANEILKKSQINPKLRAEDLILNQWLKLYKTFVKIGILK